MSGDAENVGEAVERLIRRRRRLLLVSVLSFLAWQGGNLMTISHLAERITQGHGRLVDLVTLSGAGVWIVSLLLLLATGGRQSRSAEGEIRDALEDELTQENRRRAFMAGYWALMLAVGALYALSLFTPISALEILPTLIAVGVSVPILRFVILDWRGEANG